MRLIFRAAQHGDVPAVVALLQDDVLGQGREQDTPGIYLAAFDQMQKEGNNTLIVGETSEGAIVATVGGLLGVGLGIGYAWLMIAALTSPDAAS